jgi:hypothetical protein
MQELCEIHFLRSYSKMRYYVAGEIYKKEVDIN